MFAGKKHRGPGDSAPQGGRRARRKASRRPGLFGRAWRLSRRVFVLGVGGAIGALVSYYWDPERGHARRARQADQLQAAFRQQRTAAEGQARYLTGKLKGATHNAGTATVGDPDAPASDGVIVERVRSQVLGRPEFSSFTVNVEALDGSVTLRGELPDNGHIQALCQAVHEVPGVNDVHSYLHLPHTPAPNKAEAIRHS